MDQLETYALLAADLERLRALPWLEVVERLGKPAAVSSAMIDDAEICIEIYVSWSDDHRDKLRVNATAYGPGHARPSAWKSHLC